MDRKTIASKIYWELLPYEMKVLVNNTSNKVYKDEINLPWENKIESNEQKLWNIFLANKNIVDELAKNMYDTHFITPRNKPMLRQINGKNYCSNIGRR